MYLTWIYAIVAAFIISLIALIGILFLPKDRERIRERLSFIISLAVGALLGGSFLHLLPEAFNSHLLESDVGLLAIAGIFVFFVLDKFLHWHCHNGHCNIQPVGYKILVADGVHNFIDGIAIGTAFIVNPALGVTATIAVALHEIPQEIVDFGILIHAGFKRTKALLLNLISALFAVLGTIIALLIGTNVESFVPVMLAFTAGMFVYLAGVDLIPELHKEKGTATKAAQQIIAILLGVVIMLLI